MDINQSISALRYMIAQRQALVDLEEILTRIQDADKVVADANKDRDAALAQVAAAKAELESLQVKIQTATNDLANLKAKVSAHVAALSQLG